MWIVDNLFQTKTKEINKETKSYINTLSSDWRNYLWWNIGACGNVRFTQQSFYDIHKKNILISSYYRKIVKMVGMYGFRIYDMNNETIKNDAMLTEIVKFFSIPNFGQFKQQFYTQAFCSWQVFGIVGKENMLWEKKIKILDSRGMKINIDQYWDPTSYMYGGWIKEKAETYMPDDIIDDIVYYDHDIPYKWISLYEWLLTDAMTDAEASKTNYFYFENNARPWVIVRLSQDLLNNPQELANFKKEWKERYEWSKNNNKPVVSAWIEDVKVLEMNNSNNQLLDLRKFIDTKVALAFRMDKRLVGYNVESGWSRSEIDSVSQIQGNVAISEFSDMIDSFMTEAVKKFLITNWSFEWYRIHCINEKFSNELKDKEFWVRLVENGIATREEYRKEYDMDTENLPNWMDRFTIPSTQKFIDEKQNIEETK